MRNCRDSFLDLLRDELTSLTIHPIFTDPNYPKNANLKLNAVNVAFEASGYDPHINLLSVSIDVVYDSEFDGVAAEQLVFELLSKRFFTEKYNFTNPSSPAPTGTNIFWDSDAVSFFRVPEIGVYHSNATFDLRHYIILN